MQRPFGYSGVAAKEVRLNRIVQSDNLEALRRMESASVSLIYIDPPFNTGRRQTRLRIKTVRDWTETALASAGTAIAPSW